MSKPEAVEVEVIQPNTGLLDRPETLQEALRLKLAILNTERQNLEAEADARVRELATLPLVEPEDGPRYQLAINRLKDLRETLEFRRSQLADPIRKAWESARGFYNPAIEKYTAEEKARGQRMLAFTREQQRREEEKRAELERREVEARRKRDEEMAAAERTRTEAGRQKRIDAAEAQNAVASMAAVEAAAIVVPPSSVRSSGGTGFAVETWHARVIKPADLPREYLKENEAAIDEALQANVRRLRATAPKGTRVTPDLVIPGVEFFPKESWRNRR